MRKYLLAGLAALVPAMSAAAPIGPFSDLVIFGDSLSDSGNIFEFTLGTVPDPLLYPDGQFTNGATWATQLGAAPSLRSGTNFAFGGARASTNSDPVPDFAAQRALFDLANPRLGPNPLTVVWFGGNDLRDGFAASATLGALIGRAVADIVAGVNRLVASGLDDIFVLGVPNLGRIPEVTVNGAEAIAGATLASRAFNAGLSGALRSDVPRGNVRFLDTFGLFESIANDPAAFGFTNADDACLAVNSADPAACFGAAGFVFHDSIHPTEQVHAILANAVVIAAVPLPAGGLLLLGGLAAIVLLRRRA